MNTPTLMQQTLFGEPEPVTSYDAQGGRGCDLPVACERELLWPAALVEGLIAEGMTAGEATELLERLYGDVPRRTRLRVFEICRRMRCDCNMVYRHIESGELSAIDVGAGGGERPTYRVYRASLVTFLARREFGPVPGRTDCSANESQKLSRAVARMRRASAANK